ncbi:hypothetical protein [Anabaena lutea]|uniref:Uncharacterized protein n=1 Tax=Anabaena lutea FACHB-196 TaxID=2692881 RepID=A0ABR8FNL2_9NOST|nr:hypothetical protein [Anabaena lutea]MBD2571350.1 hypothetical protein [Anabaena lutea FACHB-196]
MTLSLTPVNFPSDGRMIILPGDPGWDWTLTQPPPNWKEMAAKDPDGFAFVFEPESGTMRVANSTDLEEYLYGGEYDERLEEIGMTDEWDG